MMHRTEGGDVINVNGYPAHRDKLKSGNGDYPMREAQVMVQFSGMRSVYTGAYGLGDAQAIVAMLRKAIREASHE